MVVRSIQDGAAVVLAGLGAATCLGTSVTAAAAARAGMARFAPLRDRKVRDPSDGQMVPLTGAPALTFTAGFEGRGRLVRLALAAVRDLRSQLADPKSLDGRLGLFITMSAPEPDPDALDDKDEGGQDDEEVDEEDAAGESWPLPEGFAPAPPDPDDSPPPPTPEEWAYDTAVVIANLAALPGLDKKRVYARERAGTVAAIGDAITALGAGTVDSALVLATDSAIDDGRLSRWADKRRLKTPQHPVGLQAGEAGCAMLLTRRTEASEERPLLRGPFLAREPLVQDELPGGQALVTVMTAAAAAARRTPGVIYADCTGEVPHAFDLGSAIARLPAGSPLRAARPVMPAAAFGETGAAAPLLGVLLSARAFARHYEPSDAAVVLVSIEDGTRAALLLERGAAARRTR